MKPLLVASTAALLLASCTANTEMPPTPDAIPAPPVRDPAGPSYPGEKTNIISRKDADRLLANKGVTLQWIDWDTRGTATVLPDDDLWKLRAAQNARNGKGRLILDGAILEIGEGYFTFRGRIRVADAPDPGRMCDQSKTWHFAITQNRPYYRLREFEWCDHLTDYIDIYF